MRAGRPPLPEHSPPRTPDPRPPRPSTSPHCHPALVASGSFTRHQCILNTKILEFGFLFPVCHLLSLPPKATMVAGVWSTPLGVHHNTGAGPHLHAGAAGKSSPGPGGSHPPREEQAGARGCRDCPSILWAHRP